MTDRIVNKAWMVRERNGTNFLIKGDSGFRYSLGYPTGPGYAFDRFICCFTKFEAELEAKLFCIEQRKRYGSVKFRVKPVKATITWEVGK